MKIAIISDIHDNSHNLVCALEIIEKKKAKQIIFLGDFIANGIAKILAASKIPVFAIWGNNDGDKPVLIKTSLAKGSNLTITENVYDSLEFDKRKIFITHYPDLAKPKAQSGKYDAVFYGHNHLKNQDKIDDCLVVNPGEIAAQKTGKSTFVIYETKDNSVEFVEIKKPISVMTDKVRKHLKKIEFEFSKTKRHQY